MMLASGDSCYVIIGAEIELAYTHLISSASYIPIVIDLRN